MKKHARSLQQQQQQQRAATDDGDGGDVEAKSVRLSNLVGQMAIAADKIRKLEEEISAKREDSEAEKSETENRIKMAENVKAKLEEEMKEKRSKYREAKDEQVTAVLAASRRESAARGEILTGLGDRVADTAKGVAKQAESIRKHGGAIERNSEKIAEDRGNIEELAELTEEMQREGERERGYDNDPVANENLAVEAQ